MKPKSISNKNKKRNQKWKSYLFLLIIVSIVAVLTSINLIVSIVNNAENLIYYDNMLRIHREGIPMYSSLTVVYDKTITEHEKYCINKTLEAIDPLYKSKTAGILFTKDGTQLPKRVLAYNQEDYIVVGLSKEVNEQFLYVLCHELMHGLIDLGYDDEEKVVDDISSHYGICYTNKSIVEDFQGCLDNYDYQNLKGG